MGIWSDIYKGKFLEKEMKGNGAGIENFFSEDDKGKACPLMGRDINGRPSLKLRAHGSLSVALESNQ